MADPIRILVVEDEVLTAMMMQAQLKKAGYSISRHVTTGENAILSAKEDPPDLILMDIRLAGKIDGVEAAAAINAEREIPVIFVTGYDEKIVRERAGTLKPLAFMVKPVTMRELEAKIDGHFRQGDQAVE
jgi:DNA-binding response OmpR family regulator